MIHLNYLLKNLVRGKVRAFHGLTKKEETDAASMIDTKAHETNCFQLSDIPKDFLVKQPPLLPFDSCWFEYPHQDKKNTIGTHIMQPITEYLPFSIWIYDHKKQWALLGVGSLKVNDPQSESDLRFSAPNEGEDLIIQTLHIILKYCDEIALSRVISTKHVAKKIRNQKKNGKFPTFDYHELTLKTPNIRTELRHQGGTHASPRPHDRRAHKRRLKSGKIITVKSSRINKDKPGFIFKDYKIKNTTASRDIAQ